MSLGRLMEPPSRVSAWRLGFSTPVHYTGIILILYSMYHMHHMYVCIICTCIHTSSLHRYHTIVLSSDILYNTIIPHHKWYFMFICCSKLIWAWSKCFVHYTDNEFNCGGFSRQVRLSWYYTRHIDVLQGVFVGPLSVRPRRPFSCCSSSCDVRSNESKPSNYSLSMLRRPP